MNPSQFFKICIVAGVVGTLLTGISFMMSSNDNDQMKDRMKGVVKQFKVEKPPPEETFESPKDLPDQFEVVKEVIEPQKPTSEGQKAVPVTVKPEVFKALQEVKSNRPPSVHIFYYPWYDSPKYDNGTWQHWNHEYLPNWDTHDKHVYPTGRHVPPDDIGAWFYPSLGPYSSRDPAIIDQHMKWISSAGIDVVAVSWIAEKYADPNSHSWDSLMPSLLDAAEKYKMKLVFHLEPYKGRSALSVKDDIVYLIEKYGSHNAFYKTVPKNKTNVEKEYPLFYVYDSYLVKTDEWREITLKNGSHTIRDTPFDSLLLGLYVKYPDRFELLKAGFDGLYTYFAAEEFSHGSTMANWPGLSTFCAKNGLLFVPSVGPGYIDTRVRAWNNKTTRARDKGEYYKEHFKMAHTAKADIVSITSFNEWHEGTQIEPAVAHSYGNFTYMEYDKNPEEYLEITLKMVNEYFTPPNKNIPMQIARVV